MGRRPREEGGAKPSPLPSPSFLLPAVYTKHNSTSKTDMCLTLHSTFVAGVTCIAVVCVMRLISTL
jgi:hypothetical protein